MTTQHTATYSPDDNKLRMYPACRLDADEYASMKDHGFKWAPKQELFVAPMWTPERAALLAEMCGEIGDEDTSLVERAEERAERFRDYSDNRAEDAAQARAAVAAIADNIPMGQPILVGHHSERKARKDAEKIERGMRHAVKMWETAEYWKRRAAGALHHAAYKERPDVRARRIRTIEADLRKRQRQKAGAEDQLAMWEKVASVQDADQQHAAAVAVANQSHLLLPRKEGDREDFNQQPGAWAALTNQYPSLYAPRTVAEVLRAARKVYPRIIAKCDRWIAHYENRLTYERAMLGEQSECRPAAEVGGAVKCWARRGGWSYIVKVNKISVAIRGESGGRVYRTNMPLDKCTGIMSAAQVQAAREAGTLVEVATKTGFYLTTDSPRETHKAERTADEIATDAMRDQIKQGVHVVSAPTLYATPRDIADRIAALAELEPGLRVLEPSAGTGALIDAVMRAEPSADVLAVEQSGILATALRDRGYTVNTADFMQWSDPGTFDRVVMNPPFNGGSDIQHIRHALDCLKPDGLLVAICANGPRQREALQPLSESWENLPADTFKNAGTSVNAALITIRN